MGTLESQILRFITDSPAKVSFKCIRDTFCNSPRKSAKDLKQIIAKLIMSGTLCYTTHYGQSFIEFSYDKPRLVSDHVVIKPPKASYSASSDQRVISLERGAAFGGGEHSTTRLAIQLVDQLLHKPYWRKKKHTLQAVDIGTGSGVLAIVAAKIGVGMVWGIDTDPCSIHEAKKNVCRNHLEDRVCISGDDLNELTDSYDLVFANLRTPTLIAIHEIINQKARSKSVLIFSGLKINEKESVCDCYQSIGYRVLENRKEKDWGAICLARGEFLNEGRGCMAVY